MSNILDMLIGPWRRVPTLVLHSPTFARSSDRGRPNQMLPPGPAQDVGMPPNPVDPAVVRHALERQLSLLSMVAEHLRAAAAAQSPMHSAEWHGRAADQAAEFFGELRARLRDAEGVTDNTVREVRLRIAMLS
jgi:hypothetical protein